MKIVFFLWEQASNMPSFFPLVSLNTVQPMIGNVSGNALHDDI